MQDASHPQTSTPELAAYRTSSWRFAPEAWETAGPILDLWWREQEPRNRMRRVQQTTGRRHAENSHFAGLTRSMR